MNHRFNSAIALDTGAATILAGSVAFATYAGAQAQPILCAAAAVAAGLGGFAGLRKVGAPNGGAHKEPATVQAQQALSTEAVARSIGPVAAASDAGSHTPADLQRKLEEHFSSVALDEPSTAPAPAAAEELREALDELRRAIR
jgi:hypothetical protein